MIDVIVPFVKFTLVEIMDDANKFGVVIFDNTFKLDIIADDPEIFVTIKFVVVVLIVLTCVVFNDDVVISVKETCTAFILFVICSDEADIFDVNILVFVIFDDIKLVVVRFVVLKLDVSILDDVIFVF